MFHTIKRLVAYMPIRWQQGLKRKYYAYKIYRGGFHAHDPEYQHLESFISKGDWVLDIGANIGHYTLKFSSLVGENGRVFAIEPVPETFELLAANVDGLVKSPSVIYILKKVGETRIFLLTPPWPFY